MEKRMKQSGIIFTLLFLLNVNAGEIVMLSSGEGKIPKNKTGEYEFKVKDGENRQIRLSLDARLDWKSLGGFTTGMSLTVNGKTIQGKRLLNKPLKFKMRNGSIGKWNDPDGKSFILMYEKGFTDAIKTNKHYIYGLIEDHQDPFRFVFDISGMTEHTGVNRIALSAVGPLGLVIRNLKIEFDSERMPRINDDSAMVLPAPTGRLNDFRLKKLIPSGIQIGSGQDAMLSIIVNGTHFPVKSRYSLPGGRWAFLKYDRGNQCELLTPYYKLSRRMEIFPDHIKFHDTFINLRNEVTGVMLENTLFLPEKPRKILRGGSESELPVIDGIQITAQMKDFFVGMIAEDDILRNQAKLRKNENALIMQDFHLGLPPNGKHTLEWSLYLLPRATYYDFVNAVRRAWNSSFTWEGPLAFPRGGKITDWNANNVTEDFIKAYLRRDPVTLVMTHLASSPSIPMNRSTIENPWIGHGTAIPAFLWWGERTDALIKTMKKVDPRVKVFAYIHKNLCSEIGYLQKYRDSVALDRSGGEKTAGQLGLFVPTRNNSYGKALAGVYRYLVEKLDANIYMDEICLGVTEWAPYQEWDHCTVEISPVTHEVVRKLSIPNLLTKPWLEEMIRFLKANGKELLANGPPVTRTLQNHHYIHFVEHGMGESGLIFAHFSTPLAWDGYVSGLPGYKHFRDSLDFGALAITRSGEWNDHTFPFTPLELNKGYLIGKERIVTKRSGRYGWNDDCFADVYVYDGAGKPVSKPDFKRVVENRTAVFELRMPSDHVAVIVKK